MLCGRLIYLLRKKTDKRLPKQFKRQRREITVNDTVSFFSKACIQRERADGGRFRSLYFRERIFDSYYNKIHDYTSKSGVVFTEILTPEYVPERLTDRETLWNEVEHVERNNKAQLA